MKHLWAPWRMSYIGSIPDQSDCVLCDVARSPDDAANLVVERRQRSFVVLNRFPYNNGHTLVCPLAHKSSLEELTSDELLELMEATRDTVALLARVMKADGFNVGLNLGRVAGAGLPGHVHLHVVPRWDGDTNFMPVLADVKVIPQALEELREKLVAARKGV
jgi:ATP adenylyltransferase